jgi:lipopolysaccharide transport system ATP-binding protein
MAEKDHQTINQHVLPDGRVTTVSGSGEASIADVRLLDVDGNIVSSVEVGDALCLEVRVSIHAAISRLVLGFMLKDRLGQAIYGINTHRLEQQLTELQAGEEAVYRFRFPARLGKGSYSVTLSLSREDSHIDKNFEWRDNALIFHVFNTQQEDFVGSAWLQAEVEIARNSIRPVAAVD